MEKYVNILEDYRDLKIDKTALMAITKSMTALPIVEVRSFHLVKVLKEYSTDRINTNYLLEWVNTIWFSEWYYYNEVQCDSIASVMSILEELDEGNLILNQEKIDILINALHKNIEINSL